MGKSLVSSYSFKTEPSEKSLANIRKFLPVPSGSTLLQGHPDFRRFKSSSIRLQRALRFTRILRTIADEQIVEGNNGVQFPRETLHTMVPIASAGNCLRRPQQSTNTLDRCHDLGCRHGTHELRQLFFRVLMSHK